MHLQLRSYWIFIASVGMWFALGDDVLRGESKIFQDVSVAGKIQHRSRPVVPAININRATVDELSTLPGVGPVTAKRIVAYRTKNPPFRRIEELLIIRGISRGRLEQMRERICVK